MQIRLLYGTQITICQQFAEIRFPLNGESHKKGDRPPGQPPPVKYRKKLFVLSALTASATSATAVTATSSTVVARLLSLSSDTCVR